MPKPTKPTMGRPPRFADPVTMRIVVERTTQDRLRALAPQGNVSELVRSIIERELKKKKA